MPVFNGFDEALKLLRGLDVNAQTKLLDQIENSDPQMAQKLRSQLHSLEDLQNLTELMLVDFLKGISLETVGLALRSVKPEVSQAILSKVSTGIKLDIEDGLKGKPVSSSKVQEARSKVLQHLNDKFGNVKLERDYLV